MIQFCMTYHAVSDLLCVRTGLSYINRLCITSYSIIDYFCISITVSKWHSELYFGICLYYFTLAKEAHYIEGSNIKFTIHSI